MAFKDYSTDPDANTTIGESIYIGPNMARNLVRPALQQIAADGRELYDEFLDSADPTPSGLARAATRAALAATASPTAGMARILAEAGREGLFVFDASNLSANVTADPAQAIYVAPASDTTGATGAWVRKYSGAKNLLWYGAVGDLIADDTTAIQRWLDAGGAIYAPFGGYRHTSRLLGRRLVQLSGDSYGFDARFSYDNMPGTRFIADAGVPGIYWQNQGPAFDDVAAALTAIAGGTFVTQEGSTGSSIRDVAFIGSGGATATGWYARTLLIVNNVHVVGFSGEGFDIDASAVVTTGEAAGYSNYGNASKSKYTSCFALENGSHGWHVRGYDANTIKFDNIDASSNGGWGILDESLIGNDYDKPHLAGNAGGAIKANRSHTCSFYDPYIEGAFNSACEISGSCVVTGNDISASNTSSSNSPLILAPATSTFNKIRFQWTFAPAALSSDGSLIFNDDGLHLQGRGSAKDVSLVNKNGLIAAYVPTGTQDFYILGASRLVGTDPILTLNNSGADTIGSQLLMGYSGTVKFQIYQSSGTTYISSDTLTFRDKTALTEIGTLTTAGLNLASGKVFKINGAQVVGARDTGWTADTGTAKKTATATYTVGSALTVGAAYVQAEVTAIITRQALVEAALRDATQEIKALKDLLLTHGLAGA